MGFEYLARVCLECTMSKGCVLGVARAERGYLCTKIAIKGVFGHLVWVCFDIRSAKKCVVWCGVRTEQQV